MSGRRTRAARLAGVAATVALVAGSSVAAADPGAGYRAKAQRLNVQAQNLDTRTHRALLDLYALESQLGTARTRLAALEARSQRLRTRRQALSQQLAAARQTLAVSEQNLAAHLRALYEQGTADPLAVVLGAQSLSDALAKLDGLSHIAAENRRMVAVTRQAKATLAHARSALAAQQARLGRTLRDAHSAERRLASARSQRLSFVSRLRARKQLADQEINSLLTTAKAVEHKSETIAPPSAAADSNGDAPQAPASQGGRTLVVSATGYSLPGHTATGMPVGWGVVAVDPSVIPLGTRMTVPGYGEAVAADTGSAVKGADIDLWFPTLSQARAWGRRTVTIVLH